MREAIRNGSGTFKRPASPVMLVDESTREAVPSRVIGPDEEPSIPMHFSQGDRIEIRQRQAESDMVEMARGIGDINLRVDGFGRSLDALVRLSEKSDEREERREEREAAAREKREEREALILNARRSTREKIALAAIAAIVSIGSAFAIGHVTSSSGATSTSDDHRRARPPATIDHGSNTP